MPRSAAVQESLGTLNCAAAEVADPGATNAA
jgi:hypothetical protein